MSDAAGKLAGRFTWADYRQWSDDQRREIIGGEAFDMTAALLVRHQHISGALFQALQEFFKKRPCRAFYAPIDVKLSEEDIVQPDLVVVCDSSRIRHTHIEGAPNLAVEILSPHSLMQDRVRKFQLYARCGVAEYWIVNPYPALIEVFQLRDSAYTLVSGYDEEDVLRSPAFPELEIPLKDVFDFPIDPSERVQVIREARPPYLPRAVRA